MTEADLEKLLTDAISSQNAFDAWWESAGATLLRGKWNEFKNDLGLHELACTLFKLTPEGLVKIVAAVDDALKLGADLDAKGFGRAVFLGAILKRPRILWVVAQLLN